MVHSYSRRTHVAIITISSVWSLVVMTLMKRNLLQTPTLFVFSKHGVVDLRKRTKQDNHKKSLMIIASVPRDNDLRLASVWSHLECFTERVDKIVISAPKTKMASINRLVLEVETKLPEVFAKLEVQYQENNLAYDAGLWCDVLTKGNVLHHAKGDEDTYVGGSAEYNHFILINDSIMALDKTNMLLEALEEQQASLVSLNYWGDKSNATTYWVESTTRAFTLEGIQIYADKICPLGAINWQQSCPFLYEWFGGNRKKRCIVEKTEIEVAALYPPGKVHGLFKSGIEGNRRSWMNDYNRWERLRTENSFPVVKVSDERIFQTVLQRRPLDIKRCTNKTEEWKIG